MAHYLDIEAWPRRRHFRFFRSFEKPFFNLCANVDVTDLRLICREPDGPSFAIACFYLSLRAVNEIECFRYRLRGDKVLIHDVIHGGSTTLREDETFGFSYFDYRANFADFNRGAADGLEKAKAGRDLEPSTDDDALIHYSVIPWVSFTSFAHASRLAAVGSEHEDSVPKIVFGKFFEDRDRWWLPTSVEVHHALMDGLHVGRFFELFGDLCLELPGFRSGPG